MSRTIDTLGLIAPRAANAGSVKKPLRVIGIDLGTTNSSIAEIALEPGATELPEARLIEVAQSTRQGEYRHTLVPSVVAIEGGRTLVGQGAKMLRPQANRHGLERYRDLFWDCKNEIGTRRTYQRAPEGYRRPREVGGHVLRFLAAAARAHRPEAPGATVVTTPASFQAAQRNDTVEAARLAGLELHESGGLLDEPTAAVIAYMATAGRDMAERLDSASNLLVFDFGGGTCDVAVFRLAASRQAGQPIDIAPLAVSRYCRLGGGDIDLALVLEVLLPQLLEQSGLEAGELGYSDKAERIIPGLLGAAESLKIGLCNELARQLGFGRSAEECEALETSNPGAYPCTLRSGRELLLESPRLSLAQLDRALEPFLDEDFLFPQVSEYHTACSIYAPLKDATSRAGLAAEEVDHCLLVGGGSLIPQVAAAIGGYFPQAQLLRFKSAEDMLTAVSRGAALQALSLEMHGRGIFRAVAGECIAIRSNRGPQILLERGEDLPHPPIAERDNREPWAKFPGLVVPQDILERAMPLRVELCDSEDRTLFAQTWDIEPIAKQGDPLLLRYRMDANQVFHFELSLTGGPEAKPFKGEMENPLTNVVNTNAKRDELLELEEKMRDTGLSAEEKRATVKKIANLDEELGNNERALELYRRLCRQTPEPDLLISMAILHGRMGDHEREEKCLLQAAKAIPRSGTPLFILAIVKFRRGDVDVALGYVDQAIAIEANPPYRVLKAQLENVKENSGERDAQLELAIGAFGPVAVLDNWKLDWYEIAAKLAGDEARLRECQDEQRRRKASGKARTADGELPGIVRAAQLPKPP